MMERLTVFKRKNDGTYAFSGRFWAYVVIATLIIGWIGYRTQETADHTEQLAWETQAYAAQTQDCLNQLQSILVKRASYSAQINNLQDQYNDNRQRRDDAWSTFIIDLAQISTDQPQVERDRQAAPVISKFISDLKKLDDERARILDDRTKALATQADSPIPDPHCGQNVPK